MLQSLYIENIAVIERADIAFDAGLNILTGETGAGKSIVIDAINAVLGPCFPICRPRRRMLCGNGTSNRMRTDACSSSGLSRLEERGPAASAAAR